MFILDNAGCKIELGSIIDSSFGLFIQNEYATSKIVIIVDENTNEHCLEYLITTFDFLAKAEVILLPVGEENKTMEVCFHVWEALSEYGIGRRDLVINLGGGVVTDMGGFIASIYKRGVDFINIPTSLLGMVDASIGGKNGVDLDAYKNQLGVFRNPKAIYIDTAFLKTLDLREKVNGFAEILKHALIKDAELWNQLAEIEDLLELEDESLLDRIISIKVAVVNEDPTEQGIRKILNFGHTVGHALEGHFLFESPIDHGHSVAIGMIAESYISMHLGKLSAAEFSQIEQLILSWYPIPQMAMNDVSKIIELLYNDKKNHSGKIQCCLLDKIGNCLYDQAVEESYFADALVYLINKTVSLN